MWAGWHHALRLPLLTCRNCWEHGERDRGEWCLVDPADQRRPDEAEGLGLQLVAHPPAVAAAPGRLDVVIDGRVVADVDVALCGICRAGVIEHVRTDPTERRRGLGWTAVAAALVRGPGYRWSTTAVTTESAHQFWTAVLERTAPSLDVGRPRYCPHMRQAWQHIP